MSATRDRQNRAAIAAMAKPPPAETAQPHQAASSGMRREIAESSPDLLSYLRGWATDDDGAFFRLGSKTGVGQMLLRLDRSGNPSVLLLNPLGGTGWKIAGDGLREVTFSQVLEPDLKIPPVIVSEGPLFAPFEVQALIGGVCRTLVVLGYVKP